MTCWIDMLPDESVAAQCAKEDPAICARCALTGPTCCTVTPGSEANCFPVSEMEWERVLEHAGERGAFVRETNTQPFRHMVARLFPGEHRAVEELFPHHKVHLRLATTPAGQCIFASAEGCELPREARPYYCRIFPLWVYGERLTVFNADGCSAVREGRGHRGVMAMLGTTENEVRSLFGRLRLAWGLDPGPGFATAAPQAAAGR